MCLMMMIGNSWRRLTAVLYTRFLIKTYLWIILEVIMASAVYQLFGNIVSS